MTPFPTSETAGDRPSAGPAASPRHAAQARTGAVLVPFPGTGTQRRRAAPPSGERRGEILFFLGVRYERLAS